MLSRSATAWGAHLLAAAASLALTPHLHWAGQLGFYDSDYNQIVNFLHAERSVERSTANLAWWFFSDEPLFNVYHGLRYLVLGTEPRIHHLLHGAMVAANALLAFSLVLRLSGRLLFSFLFLVLFLTFPGRGEAHYWPGAVYPLMLLALLGAAHWALSWGQSGRRWTYAACWACYSIAIFTHEAAFGFLGVFAALWWVRRLPLGGLAPLAVSNAAYLLARQTQWLGFGDPGYFFMRPLQPGSFFRNLSDSVAMTMGGTFLEQASQLLQRGGREGSVWPALAGILAMLVAAALPGGWRRYLAEGMLLFPALVASAGFYFGGWRAPDWIVILPMGLAAVAFLALAGVVEWRLAPQAADRELLRLAGFGAAWFFCAYSPTYLLYIANRHSYLPSVGGCLALAAAMAWPAACARDPRRRRLLEGVAVSLVAFLGAAFHTACVGEAARWARAGQFTASLQAQMRRLAPRMAQDTRVVVLDVPDSLEGIPLLPAYAMQAALRHWYDNMQILAANQFVPDKTGFLLPAVQEIQHYQLLRLFTFSHQKLEPVGELVFEDGERVRLGEGVPLAVTAGRERR